MNKNLTLRMSFKKYFFLSITILLCVMAIMSSSVSVSDAANSNEIVGNVFLDTNGDSRKVAPGYIDDPGVKDVKVTAFDSTGASAYAFSDESGNYTITISSLAAGPYRVELSVPTGYTSSTFGTVTQSSVRQRVDAGAEAIDFGILDPTIYCASNPRLISSCFAAGDGKISVNGANATGPKAAIKAFRFDDTGYPGSSDYSAPSVLNTQSQVGTVYGLGYSRQTDKVYEGAFLRRHAGVGPGGLGAIYEIDSSTGAISNTIVIPNVGSEPTGRGLTGDVNTATRDIAAFSAVGKVGLGDVDVIGDGNTLITTNLNTRSLVVVTNLSSSKNVNEYSLPASVSCPGGNSDRRVFGTGSKTVGGALKVYVGVTCTGETNKLASELVGKVIEFDVASSTWGPIVLTFPLNYQKGCALVNSLTGNMGCAWKSWSDNPYDAQAIQVALAWGVSNPQPIISEIEFDQTGAMVIGIADRGGWQWGYKNLPPLNAAEIFPGVQNPLDRSNQLHDSYAAGDQLRACASGAVYSFESNGSCGGVTTFGAGNSQGNSGGEFYWGDTISRTKDGITIGHEELGLGAFAYVPGRTTMAATVTDPFFTKDGVNDFRSNSVGVIKLAHADAPGQTAGQWVGALELGRFDDGTNGFAKAGGLGDIEVLCESAPVEIGNYVWLDTDKDGIQDPNETPLSGVRVKLVDPSNNDAVLATAITDVNGHYLFASQGVGNVVANGWSSSDETDAYGIVPDPNSNLGDANYGIKANHNYVVTFDVSGVTSSDPGTFVLTTANSDGSVNGDLRDSDAVNVAGVDTINVETGDAGDNDHSFDVGYYFVPEETTTSSTSTSTTSSTTTTSTTTTTTSTTTTTTTTTTVPVTVLGTVVTRPTSTVIAPTTSVAVLGTSVSKSNLPTTGSDSSDMSLFALMFIAVGASILIVAKKRKISAK